MKLCLLSDIRGLRDKSAHNKNLIQTFYWTRRFKAPTLLNSVTQFRSLRNLIYFPFELTATRKLVTHWVARVWQAVTEAKHSDFFFKVEILSTKRYYCRVLLEGCYATWIIHDDDKLTCGGHFLLDNTNLSIWETSNVSGSHLSLNDYCFFCAVSMFLICILLQNGTKTRGGFRYFLIFAYIILLRVTPQRVLNTEYKSIPHNH